VEGFGGAVASGAVQLVQGDVVGGRVGHGHGAQILEGGRVFRVVAGVGEQECGEVDDALRGEHEQCGGLHAAAVADGPQRWWYRNVEGRVHRAPARRAASVS
jgi:hypothetical protein